MFVYILRRGDLILFEDRNWFARMVNLLLVKRYKYGYGNWPELWGYRQTAVVVSGGPLAMVEIVTPMATGWRRVPLQRFEGARITVLRPTTGEALYAAGVALQLNGCGFGRWHMICTAIDEALCFGHRVMRRFLPGETTDALLYSLAYCPLSHGVYRPKDADAVRDHAAPRAGWEYIMHNYLDTGQSPVVES